MLRWFKSQVEKSDMAKLVILFTPVLIWGAWRFQDKKQAALESVMQTSKNGNAEVTEEEIQKYLKCKRELRAASGYVVLDDRR